MSKPAEQTISVENLRTALNDLLSSGEFEIPDDAIAGQYKETIDQLQARVDDLTRQMVGLAAEVDRMKGVPVKSERVNALEVTKEKKK